VSLCDRRDYSQAVLRHEVEGWDMHDHGGEITKPVAERRREGDNVQGVVVCHHQYGLGVYLPDRDEYGHVNITSIKPPGQRIDGPADFPPIGSEVEGTVLGYTEIDSQLRITLVPRGAPSESDGRLCVRPSRLAR
jgi:hypothetical protein